MIQHFNLVNRMYGENDEETISKADSDKFSKKQQKTALKTIKADGKEEEKIAGYALKAIASDKMKWLRQRTVRRLEPIDRVKELGDASVPFLFDIHAMVYSNDAPTLEKKLHSIFDSNRVNMVNTRKEFFEVTLDSIAAEVKNIAPQAIFVETAEARQYKESIALRAKQQQLNMKGDVRDTLPNELQG